MPHYKNKLPDFLAFGEKARLIPVVSAGSKESRATSIALATLSAVQAFSKEIFGAIGIKVGSKTTIDVYTEVVFKGESNLRPDGLIIVDTGRTQWKALVEAKIGSSNLESNQIKNYLALAKKNKIDAVITISNQYSAIPSHHPIPLRKSDLKNIDLFHFSWMMILTEAALLQKSFGVEDKEQRFLLDEMVRYFNHPKVGISSFTSMNADWGGINIKIRSGSSLSKTSDETKNTVISWHQEARDLCLILTDRLVVPVSLRLNRNHTQDPIARLKNDCEILATNKTLSCELDIPNAASPLKVTADLIRRTIDCSMTLNTPTDKKTGSGRLNWLLRQLKNSEPQDVYIRAYRYGSTNHPHASLKEIRTNPKSLLIYEDKEIQPVAFDVSMRCDLAKRFEGRNTFIEDIEKTVIRFYEELGQNLQTWTPPVPKVKKVTAETLDPAHNAASDVQEDTDNTPK